MSEGATFVVPVHNGEAWLERTLAAIFAQHDGRPIEVLVVDDRSTDGSRRILDACTAGGGACAAAGDAHAAAGRVRVLDGEGRGAAAAINVGIRHATHPIICQIDQDVILEPGWLQHVTAALSTADVGAAQGYYVTPRDAGVWARVMGLDLEDRYARIPGGWWDHVCSGNTAYRADALRRVGLFDEALGYGYDNDMSYRLASAGYRLAICRAARSVHRWRDSALAYLSQQYGVGYGRLEVVARHPRRIAGDDVSGPGMIVHAGLMTVTVGALATAACVALAGGAWTPPATTGMMLVGALGVERVVAGVRAMVRFGDPAALAFAPVHLLRDLAWTAAVVAWAARRLLRRAPEPSHSMAR